MSFELISAPEVCDRDQARRTQQTGLAERFLAYCYSEDNITSLSLPIQIAMEQSPVDFSSAFKGARIYHISNDVFSYANLMSQLPAPQLQSSSSGSS